MLSLGRSFCSKSGTRRRWYMLVVGLTLGCRQSAANDAPVPSIVHPQTAASSAPAPHILHLPSDGGSAPESSKHAQVNGIMPLSAGSAPKDVKSKPRVCSVAVMGDSLSDPRSAGGHYVRILQSRAPKSRFDNYGKGGHMTNQMRRRFQRDILGPNKPRYTHVIVFGGVNDLISNLTAHRTNERIESDLAQMYVWAKQADARVVGVTVTPWGGFKRYFNQERGKNTQLLNAWILSQQGQLLDVAVDGYSLLSCTKPHHLCPEHVPPFNDGLHFGKEAHAILAEALWQAEFSRCL